MSRSRTFSSLAFLLGCSLVAAPAQAEPITFTMGGNGTGDPFLLKNELDVSVLYAGLNLAINPAITGTVLVDFGPGNQVDFVGGGLQIGDASDSDSNFNGGLSLNLAGVEGGLVSWPPESFISANQSSNQYDISLDNTVIDFFAGTADIVGSGGLGFVNASKDFGSSPDTLGLAGVTAELEVLRFLNVQRVRLSLSFESDAATFLSLLGVSPGGVAGYYRINLTSEPVFLQGDARIELPVFSVPEPSSFILLAFGAVAMGVLAVRRRK